MAADHHPRLIVHCAQLSRSADVGGEDMAFNAGGVSLRDRWRPGAKTWADAEGQLVGRLGIRPGSDPESYTNDGLGDHPQAGVVAARVPTHELVGLIDRDRFLLCGDPLGLFDDDP
jgi:hypothetical protein